MTTRRKSKELDRVVGRERDRGGDDSNGSWFRNTFGRLIPRDSLKQAKDLRTAREALGPFDSFEGTDAAFSEWFERFRGAAERSALPSDIALALLPTFLKGKAELAYAKLGEYERRSWRRVYQAMSKAMKNPFDIEDAHRELMFERQGARTVESYFKDVQRRCAIAFQGLGDRAKSDGTVRYFIQGLNPDLQKGLRGRVTWESVEEVKAAALNEERFRKLRKGKNDDINLVDLQEELDMIAEKVEKSERVAEQSEKAKIETKEHEQLVNTIRETVTKELQSAQRGAFRGRGGDRGQARGQYNNRDFRPKYQQQSFPPQQFHGTNPYYTSGPNHSNTWQQPMDNQHNSWRGNGRGSRWRQNNRGYNGGSDRAQYNNYPRGNNQEGSNNRDMYNNGGQRNNTGGAMPVFQQPGYYMVLLCIMAMCLPMGDAARVFLECDRTATNFVSIPGPISCGSLKRGQFDIYEIDNAKMKFNSEWFADSWTAWIAVLPESPVSQPKRWPTYWMRPWGHANKVGVNASKTGYESLWIPAGCQRALGACMLDNVRVTWDVPELKACDLRWNRTETWDYSEDFAVTSERLSARVSADAIMCELGNEEAYFISESQVAVRRGTRSRRAVLSLAEELFGSNKYSQFQTNPISNSRVINKLAELGIGNDLLKRAHAEYREPENWRSVLKVIRAMILRRAARDNTSPEKALRTYDSHIVKEFGLATSHKSTETFKPNQPPYVAEEVVTNPPSPAPLPVPVRRAEVAKQATSAPSKRREESRRETEAKSRQLTGEPITCKQWQDKFRFTRILLNADATAALRYLLNRENVVATVVTPDNIWFVECEPRWVSKIYTNHSINGTCYRGTPVETDDGRIMFLTGGKNELKQSSATRSCKGSLLEDSWGWTRGLIFDRKNIMRVVNMTRWRSKVSDLIDDGVESASSMVEKTAVVIADGAEALQELLGEIWFVIIVIITSGPLLCICCCCVIVIRKRKATRIQKSRSRRHRSTNRIPTMRDIENGGNDSDTTESVFITTGPKNKKCVPHINMAINGIENVCLIDTGATISYCGMSVAKKLQIKTIDTSNACMARTADNTIFPLLGSATVLIKIGNKLIPHTIKISDDKHCPVTILLGSDFIYKVNENRMRFALDLVKGVVAIGSTEFAIVSNKSPARSLAVRSETSREVRISSTTEIPGRSMECVRVRLDGMVENRQLVLIEDNLREDTQIYSVIPTISVPSADGCYFVCIVNPSAAPVRLYKGTRIAKVESVNPREIQPEFPVVYRVDGYESKEIDWHERIPAPPKDIDPNFDILNEVQINSELTPSQVDRIGRLVRKFQGAFVGADGQVGTFNGPIQHRIDLKDETKFPSARIRRIPLERRIIVQDQIQEMLKQGIIRESASPFASPIVLVKKKDGTWRFTVDYRELNQLTKLPKSVIPQVLDVLDQVSHMKYFTTCDFAQGFHQIPMLPEHSERTSFSCFMGSFEYAKLPMGLSGAPHTFQRCMNWVVKGIKAKAYVYVDDLIVASPDFETHLRDLEEVLQRVQMVGMTLKGSKCFFAQYSVEFLGFILARDGLRPNPRKTKAIAEYPRPATVTAVRSFIAITKPLTELTLKDAPFQWGEKQDAAFKFIKQELLKDPILVPPKLGQPFVIETDASGLGLGAALRQGSGAQPPVIAYASRALNKHESRYPPIDLEALGIVFALNEFRPYVEGASITVITDHAPLRCLMTKKTMEGRLAKYQAQIMHFDVKIIYRPGIKNKLCDALSRNLPESEIKRVQMENIAEQVNALTLDGHIRDKIRDEQATCLWMQAVMQRIQHGENDEETDKYLVLDGILHQTAVFVGSVPKILLPSDSLLRNQIIEICHKSQLGTCHLGTKRTKSLIAQAVIWPNMERNVDDYIKTCLTCQRVKNTKAYNTVEPLGHLDLTTRPNQRIHLDHVGPLPVTNSGNKYILTIIDAFSKLAMAIPCAEISAKSTCACITDYWIAQHGVPENMVTDSGSSFVNETTDQFCKLFRIAHSTSKPYRHQSNGLVERLNRTIEQMLATTALEQTSDWDERLKWVVLAYNTTASSATKYTPFFLTYGREANNPLLNDMGIPKRRFFDQDDYVQTLLHNLEGVRTLAARNIQKAQEVQKTQYDQSKRVLESDYKMGDLVLFRQPRSSKLDPVFGEPQTVVSVKYPNVTIKPLLSRGKTRNVHMDLIRPYVQ